MTGKGRGCVYSALSALLALSLCACAPAVSSDAPVPDIPVETAGPPSPTPSGAPAAPSVTSVPEVTPPVPTPAQPTPTPAPTPEPTPSPTPEPTPTPEPELYDIESFLPLEDIHITYVDENGENVESYVEHYSTEGMSIQHRELSSEPGSPRVTVTKVLGGKMIRTFSMDNVGYTYRYLESTSMNEVLLAEPIVQGNSWDVPGGKRTITSVDKLVTVPLGTYRCVEVHTVYDDGTESYRCYVPGLGLIDETVYSAVGSVIEKQSAVTHVRDEGFKQAIRFYYAQPLTDSIRYTVKRVTIMPNASLGTRFVNNLRSAPDAGSGSLVSFSDDVTINSIRLDSEGNVHVDFSSSLISFISRTSGYTERLILNALANTFCDYFQCGLLYLTVDDRPYESPWIQYTEGEAIKPDYEKARSLN